MTGAGGGDRLSTEKMRLLVDGDLPAHDVKQLIHAKDKDPDRFWTYLEILQERVPWSEKILLRISEHLYIVRKEPEGRIVKCDCGQEFGDYRVNWKLSSEIFVRRSREALDEIYTTGIAPDPAIVEVREFYCPGCHAQLGVEVAPHGYPPVFEALPDLDGLYRHWLGAPLPDESPDWYEDRSTSVTEEWANQDRD